MSGELKVVGRQPSGALILAKLNALGAVGAAFTDSVFAIKGSGDATKKLRFEVDGFTTGTTRVATYPDADITVAGINRAQTWTATQTFAGIDATSIGATTRGTGLFTTLGANGIISATSGTAASSTTTGSLVVTGGVGISGAAYVGGLLNVADIGTVGPASGGATSANVLTLQNNTAGTCLRLATNTGTIYNWIVGSEFTNANEFEVTPSTATGGSTFSTPAIRIAGAAGGALTLARPTTITGTATMAAINASGVVTLSNSTAATSPTAAALVVTGGVGITGDVWMAVSGGGSTAMKSGLGNIIRHRAYGYSTSYSSVQIGSSTVGIGFGQDPNAITGGQFTGDSTDVFFTRGAAIGCPNAGATDWVWGLKIAGGSTSKATPQVVIDETSMTVNASTASSSSTTGALVVSGGLGVAKDIRSAQAILSSGATSGIGYATGAGGAVTQSTSKSTGVTLNAACGTITMNGAALASNTTVSFTLTNSAIAATDAIFILHESVGTIGGYIISATPASGSASVTVRNLTLGSLSEAIVLKFVIIKAVVS